MREGRGERKRKGKRGRDLVRGKRRTEEEREKGKRGEKIGERRRKRKGKRGKN